MRSGGSIPEKGCEGRARQAAGPCLFFLPRRYAFRYVRIDVLALSSKYHLVIGDASAETVTSADDESVLPLKGNAPDAAIDRVALRTLRSGILEENT